MALNIQQIKKRLQAKQSELQGSISDLTEAHPEPQDPIEISQGPQEFEDVAVDFQEMQQEQSIEVNNQALLSEVQAALKRIDDGSYGRCVVDGEPIPEKRLQAIPWAARCVKHQAELERQNLSEDEL
jgi:DnaK suppressor protein